MRGTSFVTLGTKKITDYLEWSDGQIRLVVPADVESDVDVTVTTDGGTSNAMPMDASYIYFAEGYTGEGFRTFLTLANPSNEETMAQIDYFFRNGDWEIQKIAIPAGSRMTVDVNSMIVVGQEFSIRVVSGGEVFAERPMYFDYGDGWEGGHCTTGTAAPSQKWYFAEGYTGNYFDQYVCVMNPGNITAYLTFNFQTEEAGKITSENWAVNPYSRATFKINDMLGAGYQNSLELVSSVPVVAERSMYFDYLGLGTAAQPGEEANGRNWQGGHCTVGASVLATDYYFAEGTTRDNFEAWITLQNPGDTDIQVQAAYHLEEGLEKIPDKTYTVPAGRRNTLFLPNEVGWGKDVSVHLTSASPFLAERPTYFAYSYQGLSAQGGHCVIGVPSPMQDWYFAEGYTGAGFDEWLCIQNPGSTEAVVEIYYFTQEEGALTARIINVPPETRKTIMVDADAGTGLQLSARVKVVSGSPVVTERPMYFLFNGVWDGGHAVAGVPR